MYAVAERLDPERYFALARAVYAEMALAGVTCVGEFHYLHHDPGGQAVQRPERIRLAARSRPPPPRACGSPCLTPATWPAGSRQAASRCRWPGSQLRFGDGSAAAWAERVSGFGCDSLGMVAPHARIGAAIHSVRAVAPGPGAGDHGLVARARRAGARAPVGAAAGERRVPRRLRPHARRGPLRGGALGPRSTLVHATHLTERDVGAARRRRCPRCACAR